MRDIGGSPGKISGLSLRVAQFLCAGASLVVLETIDGFDSSKTSINCLVLAMDLVLVWSFVLVCIDSYALKTGTDLHHMRAAWKYLLGDWFLVIFAGGILSSSVGVFVFFRFDVESCTKQMTECNKYGLSIVLALIAWIFLPTSAHAVFKLFVELFDLEL